MTNILIAAAALAVIAWGGTGAWRRWRRRRHKRWHTDPAMEHDRKRLAHLRWHQTGGEAGMDPWGRTVGPAEDDDPHRPPNIAPWPHG